MDKKLPAGLSRDDEPIYVNLEFLDGTRGAHVNISGISGVATKTTYATFLLYSLFHSGVLGSDAINTKALIFNVKGEDLLFLDRPNKQLDLEAAERYRSIGLPASAFSSVAVYAPPKRGSAAAVPDVATRTEGVTSFFWTLEEFCHEGLLHFLFADAEDDRQQYTIVIHNVEAQLRQATPLGEGGVRIEGQEVRTFSDLVELIATKVEDEDDRPVWAGRAIGQGTTNAFVRRLYAAVRHVEPLIRADVAGASGHRIELQRQVTVVDIHNLNDRAKRFVVGVVVRRAFEEKELAGTARPLLFLVLDELNKYAPREGSSPIKEILLDVAERGRSLGIILVGAAQTASEVERRIIANSAIRVVGRLDSAESGRDEYGFLPTVQRQRSTILKPGTMILSQPELPIPLVIQFPFPAWATRSTEAGPAPGSAPADPLAGLPRGVSGGRAAPPAREPDPSSTSAGGEAAGPLTREP
jgi:DNA helicase HerA-like ATPase